MANWDTVYSKKFGGTWYPNEGVVRFTARYLKRRVGILAYDTKRQVKRILDAGCGNGRHVVFFAQQGFQVYGLDISKGAVNVARAWLNQQKLKAMVQVADIEKLPFPNEYFDVVICVETLDHMLFSKARKAIREIKRVLRADGYACISLRSTESSEFGHGKKIAANTFLLQEGYEKGHTQHFFDFKEVRELLQEFRVFDIELYEQKFPALYTVHKAFFQSSQGMKKYIDLKKSLRLDLKDARWYIGVEKP